MIPTFRKEGLPSLRLRFKEEAKTFIDSLEIFSLLANVADVKSLAIHPASTTHAQLTQKEQEEQGIRPNTIRLSIGTEHIDDILEDLDTAFRRVAQQVKSNV